MPPEVLAHAKLLEPLAKAALEEGPRPITWEPHAPGAYRRVGRDAKGRRCSQILRDLDPSIPEEREIMELVEKMIDGSTVTPADIAQIKALVDAGKISDS